MSKNIKLIVFGSVLAAIAIVTGAFLVRFYTHATNEVNRFDGRLLYCTYINGIDAGEKTPKEVDEEIFQHYYPRQNFTITFVDKEFAVSDYNFDFTGVRGSAQFLPRNVTYQDIRQSREFNKTYEIEKTDDIMNNTIKNIITGWEVLDKGKWEPAEDAYITQNQETKEWYIVPDKQGTTLDLEKVKLAIAQMIKNPEASTNLELRRL